MKKFTYKVLKNFTLMKDEKGKDQISDDLDEKGSSFSKNADYIDYEFPKKDIAKSPITNVLEKKGYIELVGETEKI